MGRWADSNVDPAEYDGEEITGTEQAVSPPSKAIHCDVGGTITFVMAKGVREQTRTMVAGGVYPYSIKRVVRVGGGFAGAIIR